MGAVFNASRGRDLTDGANSNKPKELEVTVGLEPTKTGFEGRRLADFSFRREINLSDMEARAGFEPANDGFEAKWPRGRNGGRAGPDFPQYNDPGDPVAQLDRANGFEPLGSEFKSRRGRHLFAPTGVVAGPGGPNLRLLRYAGLKNPSV